MATIQGTAIIFFCAIALALGEEIEVNAVGCPVNVTIFLSLPHDTYCNLFYVCNGGGRVEQICPGELVFNPEEGICDWRLNVECGDKGTYVPEEVEDIEEVPNPGGNSDPSAAVAICAMEDSDGVLVANDNCNQFYLCSGGVPVARDCPPDLLYNPEIGVCDWPHNVECGDRVVPTFAQIKRAALNKY